MIISPFGRCVMCVSDFRISNLGMFGSVTNFTAIINPPQAAILAVGGPQTHLNKELEPETRSEGDSGERI